MDTINGIGEKIKFKDGTEYMRMPNGELRRMSPRGYQLRQSERRLKKIKHK